MQNKDYKQTNDFEMWLWRIIKRIKWFDCVSNEDILYERRALREKESNSNI